MTSIRNFHSHPVFDFIFVKSLKGNPSGLIPLLFAPIVFFAFYADFVEKNFYVALMLTLLLHLSLVILSLNTKIHNYNENFVGSKFDTVKSTIFIIIFLIPVYFDAKNLNHPKLTLLSLMMVNIHMAYFTVALCRYLISKKGSEK